MKNEIYHVISNTHWDREWYQSHEKYLVRLVELMDRLLDIMEEHRDYRFVTDGQYALVEDYIASKPENYGRIKALVSDGRLLIGPWYTQPLENIVGGEALIRNLQKGIKESEKLGNAMRFSYEIDEFGHTSQLPQILAGFGINGVMAWRGVPKNCRSLFRWHGADGTTANFFNSNEGYGEATSLPDSTEDFDEVIDGINHHREGLKTHVERIRELRMKVSDSKNMVWLNGIDHSWAQADVLEICRRIEELFPELEVKQSTPEEYANAVIDDLNERNIVPPEHSGELLYTYEPVLESTNALHPRQKRRHFETEKMLVGKSEPLTEFASLLGFKYPEWAIEREWKYVLENHAHDSLGCCSVDEVFEQVMARYGASLSIGEQICEDSLRKIMSCSVEEPSIWIFNLSEKNIQGSVKVSFDVPVGFGGEKFTLSDSEGNETRMCIISSQKNGDVRYNPRLGHPTWGEVVHYEAIIDAPAVPAFGATRLKINKAENADLPTNRQHYYFADAQGILENKNFRITFNNNGSFNLYDKRTDTEYKNQLLFTDDGEAAHCYIHVEPQNDMRRFSSAGCSADINILYDNALGGAFEVKLTMLIPKGIEKDRKSRTSETEKLEISYVIALEENSEAINIDIKINNKSRNHRLRAIFPTNIDSEISFSDQAFDEVERAIKVEEEKNLFEMPYMTHPMLSYCGIKDGKKGLSVATRGIYEYECTDDASHSLAITLLRSIEVIDNDTFETTPSYFMEEAQNICEINHSISLIPFTDSEALHKEVSAFIRKPLALANRTPEESVMPDYKKHNSVISDSFRAIELSGRNLTVTTFKKASKNDNLIIRILNRGNDNSTGRLKLNIPGVEFSQIYMTDFEENRIEKIGSGNEIEFKLSSKKLITLEFTL